VTCQECDKNLIDYLYHELSPEDTHEMDAHFKACEHCAKQLSQFQLVRTSFQQLKELKPRSLIHQKILAHASDMSSQKRGSWLTQLLLKPSTAAVMVVLLTAGIFYYTQQFMPLRTNTGNMIVKSERARGIEGKKYQLGTTKPTTPEPRYNKQTDMPSPAFRAEEGTAARKRSLAAMSDRTYSERSKASIRTAASLAERRGKAQGLPVLAKDALYAFELGNFYYAQGEFEKAITTYSMALMMNPRERYADTIRYQLATSYKKLHDCNSAVKVLDDIQKSHPQHPEMDKVIIMAGDCYLDLHAYDKAETNYTNFISQYPERKSLVVDKLETARKFRRVNLTY
jgi:TolA-binding protein